MDHVKLVDRHIMRVVPWLIPFLTIGIFVIDLLAPVGIAVSILYAIPLLLTRFSPRSRIPLYFAAAATVLTWIDLLVKPTGVPIPYAVSNRALGTMLIWGIAIELIRYTQTQQELKSARLEQAHAEAQKHGIPLTSLVRVGHNAARAILESARERQCELIVMGWKGYSTTAQ
ncbi:MAG: universal stress protein, partial [Nitrospira sp.]|nr:universal stress protein [Nitrospira sp.]